MSNPFEKPPGHPESNPESICPTCGGSRKVNKFDEKGNQRGKETCPKCGGSGKDKSR